MFKQVLTLKIKIVVGMLLSSLFVLVLIAYSHAVANSFMIDFTDISDQITNESGKISVLDSELRVNTASILLELDHVNGLKIEASDSFVTSVKERMGGILLRIQEIKPFFEYRRGEIQKSIDALSRNKPSKVSLWADAVFFGKNKSLETRLGELELRKRNYVRRSLFLESVESGIKEHVSYLLRAYKKKVEINVIRKNLGQWLSDGLQGSIPENIAYAIDGSPAAIRKVVSEHGDGIPQKYMEDLRSLADAIDDFDRIMEGFDKSYLETSRALTKWSEASIRDFSVYSKALGSSISASKSGYLYVGILVIFLSVLVSVILGSYIVNPITRLRGHLRGINSKSHPVGVIDFSRKDELGEMFSEVNALLVKLKDISGSVHGGMARASHSSKNIFQIITKLENTVSSLSTHFERVNTGFRFGDEFSTKISSSALGIMKKSNDMGASINSGVETSTSARKKMTAISENVEKVGSVAKSLTSSVGEIMDALKTVHAINMQTDILSFNAMVKASQSKGQESSGFSVVAQNIKQLSENTKDTAGRIESVIKDIQADSEMIDSYMTDIRKYVADGNDLISQGASNYSSLISIIEGFKDEVSRLLDESSSYESFSEQNRAQNEVANKNIVLASDAVQGLVAAERILSDEFDMIASSLDSLVLSSEDAGEGADNGDIISSSRVIRVSDE